MKTRPFAITAFASGNVKRLENTRLRNRFARSSCRSRIIKSIWLRRWGKQFQTLAATPKGAAGARAVIEEAGVRQRHLLNIPEKLDSTEIALEHVAGCDAQPV